MAKTQTIPDLTPRLARRVGRRVGELQAAAANRPPAPAELVHYDVDIQKYQIYVDNLMSPHPADEPAGFTTATTLILAGRYQDHDDSEGAMVVHVTARDARDSAYLPPEPGVARFDKSLMLMWISYRPHQMTEALRLLREGPQPVRVYYHAEAHKAGAAIHGPETPYPPATRA